MTDADGPGPNDRVNASPFGSLGPIDPDRTARFEAAIEVLGVLVGWYSSLLGEEQSKDVPDRAEIARLRQQRAEYVREQMALDLNDDAAVERTITECGALVRRLRSGEAGAASS